MKGSEKKLASYMQGADKRFIIPVYQRNYDWKQDNCKQLYDDLVKIIKKDRKSHFFGSVVSVHTDGEDNEFLIIDGQQRVTTISILLLAMYNLMMEKVMVPEKSNLPDKIKKTYLIDEFEEDESCIKLKPIKKDRKAFQKLFGERDEYILDSNITINYQYFYSRIQKEEITIDQLYTAIMRLEIIDIKLSQDDNPQLIFESLNSTGLALNEGDKIRNFILMGLPTKEQNLFYEKYWNRIEKHAGNNLTYFIRDYLSVKQQAIPSISKVYTTFKYYVEDRNINTENLLQDMLKYAKRYEILLKGTIKNAHALKACIERLNRLETTVIRPFLLEILRIYDEKNITLQEMQEIFLLTENYVFRRSICDIPTNGLNKIFLFLHREIVRLDGSMDNYFEKFKYVLLAKSERQRFPKDNEFIEAFSRKNIYNMNNKNKIYILERFENANTLEDKDVYRHCDEGIYSVEHIMPQNLNSTWVSDLGEEVKEIHEKWLHRLANLTLTAYNSKYSNKSFKEKIEMENGFIQSGLRLNTWIAKQNKWGCEELEQRNTMLMEQAVKIWAYPISLYEAKSQYMDVWSYVKI